METNTTNVYLKFLIRLAKKTARKENARIWKAVAERLARSNRRRAEVNVDKLNRLLEDGATAVIPGKVLGDGYLEKEVTVAALTFSHAAKEKIRTAGGTILKIEDLIERTPTGSNVRIII